MFSILTVAPKLPPINAWSQQFTLEIYKQSKKKKVEGIGLGQQITKTWTLGVWHLIWYNFETCRNECSKAIIIGKCVPQCTYVYT